MLEANQSIVKTYRLGLIAPRTFNDTTFLQELIAEKISKISHVITNNVLDGGETIQSYIKKIGIPYTVYPINPQVGGVLISNSKVVQDSDFVLILHDGESKNTEHVKNECEKRNVKYKIVLFSPLPSRQNDILKLQTLIKDKLGELLESGESNIDAKFLNKLLKATE